MFKKRVFLQGDFDLVISPATKDEEFGLPLDMVLATSLGTSPTYDFTTAYGDEISLPIPEGSIKAYVEKHKEQFDFPDARIRISAVYQRAPGEKIPIPEDAKSVKASPPKKNQQ